MNIFKRLGALARAPTNFFLRVEHEPVSNSIYLYTIIILLGAVFTFPISFWTAFGTTGVSFAEWFTGGIVQSALTLVQQVVMAVVSVLLIHGFARLLQGGGEISATVKALFYPGALIGFVFLALNLIFGIIMGIAFTSGGDAAFLGLAVSGVAMGFVALALMIWGFVLIVKGLKVLHGLSTIKAVFAGIVLPLLVFIILALVLGAFFITLLGGI